MLEIITTNNAPTAIGPYSQAIKVGGFVFTSGQIPLKPDGTLETGDIKVQTQQVLNNLRGVLEAANANINHVVKCTCFLSDMNDFAAMNEVYGDFFKDHAPARSTIEVARLPKNVLIEIDTIAYL